MATYGILAATVLCPDCQDIVTDEVWFRWGHCANLGPYNGKPEYLYHVGDAIRWHTCLDGLTHFWTYFDFGGNVGTSEIADLVVRDSSQLFYSPLACKKCGGVIAGIAVVIRGGIIHSTYAYRLGDFDDNVDIYTADEDGTLRARPDLDNHPMDLKLDCDADKLPFVGTFPQSRV